MANRQPASAASRSSRSGGSRRSGRQLISTATPASRQAPKTASGSKADSGLRPRPPAEQPPGAVAQHVDVRVADRGHHPPGHRPGGHPQLGVDAGHHHVEPARAGPRAGRASRPPGCRPRSRSGCGTAPARRSARRPARAGPPAARPTARWPRSAGASGRSARSTRARGRGPPRPSPAAGCRRRTSPSACGSRRAAPRAGRPAAAAAGRRAAGPGSRAAAPPAASVMTWAVVVADARQRLQRARLDPALELARRQAVEHLGGPPEGLDAVGRRPAPLQLERDLPQCLRWLHVSCPTQTRAELSAADARP